MKLILLPALFIINKYEYETVCYPFMKNLGKAIYEFELQRKKKNKPDSSRFGLDYQ
ncbi:hypothetical protein GJU39_08030 [Pedobacter petrophilus]|uniref:Uncharacterized protein n=1 Tax=Pedobacter petrophilus TaxID=1908241 RepID=A0A7K0FZ66_9SPHI|nr:hypothetical protein [Pedobacter petrophilus]MRX76036.1 hypothetical protein [Pedobacter petrophilus]